MRERCRSTVKLIVRESMRINKEKTRGQDVDKQETNEEDVKKRTTSNWSIDIHTNM